MKISKEQVTAIVVGLLAVFSLFGVEVGSETTQKIITGIVGIVGLLTTFGIIKEGQREGKLGKLGGKIG